LLGRLALVAQADSAGQSRPQGQNGREVRLAQSRVQVGSGRGRMQPRPGWRRGGRCGGGRRRRGSEGGEGGGCDDGRRKSGRGFPPSTLARQAPRWVDESSAYEAGEGSVRGLAEVWTEVWTRRDVHRHAFLLSRSLHCWRPLLSLCPLPDQWLVNVPRTASFITLSRFHFFGLVFDSSSVLLPPVLPPLSPPLVRYLTSRLPPIKLHSFSLCMPVLLTLLEH
jgi:hypothetical protein